MARLSQALRVRPVKSEKEELTWSNLATDLGAGIQIALATAVDSPTTAGQVEVGDTIPWVYIEFNVSAETITNTKIFHWYVMKVPAGVTPGSAALYDVNTKRHVLKRGMEMVPKSVNTIIKRIFVVPLPRNLRRMGDGDKIIIQGNASLTETMNWCGIAIFRHYG